jgi:hypothetical protein
MDTRWKKKKVCDVVVTPLRIWMLAGSGETSARYLYAPGEEYLIIPNIYQPHDEDTNLDCRSI